MDLSPDAATAGLLRTQAALRQQLDELRGENARLLGELREALEEQTATAEILRVINASHGDLKPVFDALSATANRLCQSEFGGLMLYDGEVFHLAYGVEAGPEPLPPEPGSALAELVAGASVVHIADLVNTEAYRNGVPTRVRLVDGFGARTALWVALRKDDVLLGAFVPFRREMRPFTDRQIALLENFAAQAVIAMENARLITEQREALEQQTATAEVLQAINASPGDVAPVFDAMLEKGVRLSEAAFGLLCTLDGACFRVAAMHGVPAAYADYLSHQPLVFAPESGPAKVLAGLRFHMTADFATDRLTLAGDPNRRAMVELGGARTGLALPLRKDNALVGMFLVFRPEVRPFTDKQIALLENFAAQAVIAMENARLLGELRQRTGDLQESLDYQTATSDVLKVISRSGFDLDPVFQVVVETAARLCRADQAVIYRHLDGAYRWAAGTSLLPEYERIERESMINPGTGTLVGRVALHGRTVQILDAWTDPLYEAKDDARIGGVRTMVGVPLLREGVPIGVIGLARRHIEPYTQRQIELVTTFADQAVIAIENARLITEQREALERQTATAEVLRVINASPGDLAPVFDTILDKAHSLCGATVGNLTIYRDGQFHALATHGFPAPVAALMQHPSPPNAYTKPLIAGARCCQIDDIRAIEIRPEFAILRALVEHTDVRTVLFVPLRKDDALLGFISANRPEVRPFSEKEIALLENFAAQAVIAMENARLLSELQARTDELAQRQEELRVTFENMGDGVAMFDATPRLVAWNRRFQEIFDVPDGELAERRTFAEYIRYLAERGEYGEGADPDEQVRRLAGNADAYHAYERTRPDGRVIEVRRNPVPTGGFVVIYADITERKRTEAELRTARDAAEDASRTIEAAYRDLKSAQANLIQAEKMASLGQLTAGIAHEIKNPLNFVNNFALLSVELLGELKEAAAPALAMLDEALRADMAEVVAMLTSNLEKITEHGRRADGIVKSMLEHSRGGSGERRSVEINALVEEALSLAYHGARAQDQGFNITLERDFASDIAPLELAPQDMTRVFLNLFSNGFYAANRRARGGGKSGFEPRLTVTTRGRDDGVEIVVRDNGTGIPPDIQEKLFQPFFTTKPTGEGTGLGLSISYDIVTQQHGGTITVDSRVGEYTEFTVRLPRGR